LEIDNDKGYVFTRAPHQQGKMVFTAPFMIAVGENFVITVSKEPLSFFKNFIVSGTLTQATRLIVSGTLTQASLNCERNAHASFA
jgi:hypothetical protein